MKGKVLLAGDLAQKILVIANKAKNEEELKIGVEKVLEPALRELGIEGEPSYEKTVLKGSADAVYGSVIIEYEPPHKFGKLRGLNEAKNQLIKYFKGEAHKAKDKEEEVLRRTAGVGLDGHQIFFLRYTGKRKPRVSFPRAKIGQQALFHEEALAEGFHVQGPYPVAAESVEILFDYLRALAKRPLIPEALAEVFGPRGEAAKLAVNSFYKSIREARHPKVDTLFREWKRIFGVVYGQELAKAEKDAAVLARLYGVKGSVELKPLLFSVHTYFALIMKFLAAELASLQEGALVSSFVLDLPALPQRELRSRLSHLEDGGLFRELGIINLLEGDFFGWYLAAWDSEVGEAVREVARKLSVFEPATATLESEATKDLLKKLYQYLIPREIRHDLGEYYTPDWLAERLLDQLGYDGDPAKRILDPACGSGTFLVLMVRRIKEYAEAKALEPKQVVEAITKNVVGFDLNPLAVIAARTNYLLALGPRLRRYKAPLEIPVYLCDSVLMPSEEILRVGGMFPDERQGYKLPTTAGDFHLPYSVIHKDAMEKLAGLLEECIKNEYTDEEFVKRGAAKLNLTSGQEEALLRKLYRKMLELERAGKNRIWARILKNAFAPIFAGKFDYIAGNPPWVNWENLADEYREVTKDMWERYEMQARSSGEQFELGKQKRDFSMLFTYACMDNYLKQKGKLGFVITQTVFKTRGGEVFRRFRISDDIPVKVIYVDDMVELLPFEGATNRTSVLIVQRDRQTTYEVPYHLWKKASPGRIPQDALLQDVRKVTRVFNLHARPVRKDNVTSPWITARKDALRVADPLVGQSEYSALAGCCTWANGIYWIVTLETRPDGLVVVRNLHDIGKSKIRMVEEAIERDLIYPLLRGRDVRRWKADPSCLMIFPHTHETSWRAIAEETMKQQYPETYAYLKQFEEQLRERSGYKQLRQGHPFYILGNTNAEIHSSYKVVWREQANLLTTAVVGDTISEGSEKPILPDHKLMYVPLNTAEEAHYLCAVLSSTPVQFIVKGYVVETSTSTHVLENISVPRFERSNELHRELARLSSDAHVATREGKNVSDIEERIDEKVGSLWGIRRHELAAMKESLSILTWSHATNDGTDEGDE